MTKLPTREETRKKIIRDLKKVGPRSYSNGISDALRKFINEHVPEAEIVTIEGVESIRLKSK